MQDIFSFFSKHESLIFFFSFFFYWLLNINEEHNIQYLYSFTKTTALCTENLRIDLDVF